MGQLLYDKASLVNIPSRYKDGKLYNIKPSNADFEFERGTQATRVNEDGLIEYVGIGEELASNNTISNAGGGVATIDGLSVSASSDGTAASTIRPKIEFNDLEDGEVYVIKFSNIVTTGTIGFSLYNGASYEFNQSSEIPSSYVFTKNSGIFAYIAFNGNNTFTANFDISLKQISNDTPRIDYTDSNNPSLLLEPERTNLITYSWDTNTWAWGKDANPNNTTRDFGYSAPDGSNNGTLFTSIQGTNGFFAWGNIPTGVNTDYTYSIFVKKGTSETFELHNVSTSPQSKVIYNFNTDTFTTETNATGKSVEYTNGWYRISMTYPNLTQTTSQIRNKPQDGKSIYVFGAQAEQGSYATSYIPTNGEIETRNADECTGGGDADTFNDSEGTLYYEFSAFEDTINRTIQFDDGTNDNYIYVRIGGNGYLYFFIGVGGTQIVNRNWSGLEQTDNNKIAVRYSSSGYSVYVNGVERLTGTDSISFANNINQIRFTNFPNRTKMINYFPEALEDYELERLTSPTPLHASSFEDLANNNGYTIL